MLNLKLFCWFKYNLCSMNTSFLFMSIIIYYIFQVPNTDYCNIYTFLIFDKKQKIRFLYLIFRTNPKLAVLIKISIKIVQLYSYRCFQNVCDYRINVATFCFSSFLEYIYINVMGHEPHTQTHTHMCIYIYIYTMS